MFWGSLQSSFFVSIGNELSESSSLEAAVF